MTEESNISSILTQYFRHELSPTRMSEIQHLITTDPTWIKEYQSILSLTQGIRHTTLTDLQSTLKNFEKTITPSGDLSTSTTYIYESNETSGLETTPLTHRDGHEAPDTRLIQGIRYTSLQDELKKLQKIENTVKEHIEQNTKKNERAPKGARVIGIKWWAIAAGLAVLVAAGYFTLNQNKKPKYVNQYLLDHFDEYVLHDKVRAAGDTTNKEEWDRDKEIGYDLYVLQEFEEAIPYLERRWEKKRDTLALFYLEVCKYSLGYDNLINYNYFNTIQLNKLFKISKDGKN